MPPPPGSVLIDRALFDGNNALSGSGGALYVNGTNSTFGIASASVVNNRAFVACGGIIIRSQESYLFQSSVSSNLALGPFAYCGGVGYQLVFGGEAYVYQSIINDNDAVLFNTPPSPFVLVRRAPQLHCSHLLR